MLFAAVAALTLAGYATAGVAGDEGLAYGRSQAPAPLEGTWAVTIQPIFCGGPGAGLDVPGADPVQGYLTFARGGTMTETNANPAFETGQRGPGHGYWERTGRTSYQFAFEAFILFDSQLPPYRYKKGYQRLDQTLEMHSMDEFTSSGSVKFFAGTSTDNPFPSGCARSTGTRLY
jgi:hypothetical protein